MDKNQRDDEIVIYRRYIKRKNGYIDDARNHGLKAWPIVIRKSKKK